MYRWLFTICSFSCHNIFQLVLDIVEVGKATGCLALICFTLVCAFVVYIHAFLWLCAHLVIRSFRALELLLVRNICIIIKICRKCWFFFFCDFYGSCISWFLLFSWPYKIIFCCLIICNKFFGYCSVFSPLWHVVHVST